MAAPMAAKGAPRGAASRRIAAGGERVRPASALAASSSGAWAMRNPRVEERIEEVGDEVHGHEHDRDQQEGSLGDGIVARGNPVHQPLAAAARAEHPPTNNI